MTFLPDSSELVVRKVFFLFKYFRKSGGKTDTANSRGKLLVVYERAKRRPLTDIHPAACSITNFRVCVELCPCAFIAKIP